MSWRQYQSNVAGGIQEGWFWNCGAFDASDTSGTPMSQGSASNVWQQRTIDLSSLAGCKFQTFRLGTWNYSNLGDWDVWFADMALTSSDGTVIPLYNRQSSIAADPYQTTNVTNPSFTVDSSTVPTDSGTNYATAFYAGDHLGTAQMELALGGWPVWKGTYSPYGMELTSLPTSNHFKFTGKERDAESGLDYFGARYYASSMGRWLSPDWASRPEAVPYSQLDNPQSLNLYGYVLNNPLSHADADGHCDANGQNCSTWDHIAGAVGGALNMVPMTLNIPNQLFNAVSGALGGPQVPELPMIQADTHASEGGVAVGTAAATAAPLASAAAEVKTAGMVIGEVRAATAAESVPESIPAGPGARPSPTQQNAINQMGDAHGCSTCGATSPGTKTGNWVGDHQPPTKLNPTGGPQVYKAQCLQCSRQQGGQVAAAVKAAKKTETPQ